MDHLAIEYVGVDKLTPYARNARTHSRKQIKQIARSIERFGFLNPVLIDRTGTIIAGHGRVAAAKLLGLADVPVLRLEHLSDAERRAYVLADNRLAEEAGWDKDLLAIELQGLIDLDFDVELTGFEIAEVDLIMDEAADAAADPKEEDEVTLPAANAVAVTRPGDLWCLGGHRLLCGDALKAESYAALMNSERAQLVFTDPPYNVPIDGHVSGLGKVRHREFAMASGEMSEAEFTAFLATVFAHLVASSCDGAIHFICMDWRHAFEVLSAARAHYTEQKNLCVWNKANGGMGSFYRSKHELVFVFKSGAAPHINAFGLGQHGRYRTNVWDYAGANSFRAERLEELGMHPTVKPVALVADALRDCSKRGGLVLDPFLGSGTTLIACEKVGRRGRGMEIDPLYCDVAVLRWQKLVGREAMLQATGEPFEVVAERRKDEREGAAAAAAAVAASGAELGSDVASEAAAPAPSDSLVWKEAA